MSSKETKSAIWLGVALLVALLGLLIFAKFFTGKPQPDAFACEKHRSDLDLHCSTCYPLPETNNATDIFVTESRIRESYRPGLVYIQTANVECVSRGTYKRWGIMTVQDTRFYSRMSIERQLIRQEGDTLVMQVRFAENFMVGIFTDVKEARTDLSPKLQTVLNGLSMIALAGGQIEVAVPLKWLPVAQRSIDAVLKTSVAKSALGPFLTAENAKMFNQFGELRGKKFEITWQQGKGVTDVKELEGSINAREKQYLYSLSVVPDVFMFPDFDKKPGERWKVDAKDFVPFLDSSVNAKVSGSVTLKREADEIGEMPDSKKAVFSVDEGSFYLNRSHGKQGAKGVTFARWTPRGDCKYDFARGIFVEGKLAGEMIMQNKGLDLFIFEMEHTEKPAYQLQFVGEVRSADEGGRP